MTRSGTGVNRLLNNFLKLKIISLFCWRIIRQVVSPASHRSREASRKVPVMVLFLKPFLLLFDTSRPRWSVELQPADSLICSRRTILSLRISMNQTPEAAIPMGKYVVSPTTQRTDTGQYRASFSVQRTESKGSYCRIFFFDREFSSQAAARVFAITQGWLETCVAHPQMC